MKEINQKEIEVKAAEMLRELGIPASLMGYQFLMESIYLVMEDRNKIYAITKIIYPEVAKRFGSTPSRVERTMRHAIEVAWSRSDWDVLKKYFGYTVDPGKGKATNAEFIATVCEHLRLRA